MRSSAIDSTGWRPSVIEEYMEVRSINRPNRWVSHWMKRTAAPGANDGKLSGNTILDHRQCWPLLGMR
jgi:hypothetical protein